MKKRNISLPLALALCLTLCACAPNREDPGPSPSLTAPPPEVSVPVLATPSPMPTPTPIPTAPPLSGYDLPDRDYQPWQVRYMEFLTLLQTAKTTWEPGAWGELVGSESYSLYDVDKDGVPELFVKFGTCEADFFARCYTMSRDGDVVVMAAQFPFGHSSLYTYPDKNGFLRSEGHMGYHEIYEYGPLENWELPPEREIFSEEDVREYTPVDEIVPGAQPLDRFWTQLGEWDDRKYYTSDSEWREFDDGRPHPSAGKALLLPIADWEDGPAPTGDDSERARTAILAALGGETELYGASGDHFYGDVGWTAWAEYVQPGAAYPYNDQPLEISAHTWLDLNGDGQEECLLELRDSSSTYIVVLSEQDGTVYAYFSSLHYRMWFYADGTTLGNFHGPVRLSFWKGQCYEYAVPETGAPPVEWVDGSPTG